MHIRIAVCCALLACSGGATSVPDEPGQNVETKPNAPALDCGKWKMDVSGGCVTSTLEYELERITKDVCACKTKECVRAIFKRESDMEKHPEAARIDDIGAPYEARIEKCAENVKFSDH